MSREYKGTSRGFHGEITATIELDEGKIRAITSEHTPEAHIGTLGIKAMIEEMVNQNTTEVDAVTGATYSSRAFRDAVQKAYAVSKGELTEAEALDARFANPYNDESDAVPSSEQLDEAEDLNTSIAEAPVYLTEDLEFAEEYDTVIVGGGGTGLAAAVELARHNASVIVLEKAGILGGTTGYSGGTIQASGTQYQKEIAGVKEDNAEKHAMRYITSGEGHIDEGLVRDMTDHAEELIVWIADMGIKWHALYEDPYVPYIPDEFTEPRIHHYEGGGDAGQGVILTNTLADEAQEAGAEIRVNSPVVSLIQDPLTREIVGVVTEEKGERQNIKANKGVILATASIDNNPALAKKLSPQYYRDLKESGILTIETDTGDGIIMGMSVGGAITNIGGAIDHFGKTGSGTYASIPTIPSVTVNGMGNRFITEDAHYSYQNRAIFQQEKQFNKPTYFVFDQDAISEPGSAWDEATLAKDIEDGTVIQADAIEALAEKINVPAENLKRTVEDWNSSAESGEDPELERRTGIKSLNSPFYALKHTASNLGAIGGLKINRDAQVLDNFDEPIAGLYSGGMNAGGWIGGYYPGSGTAILGAVYFGRKAAQTILDK